MILALRSDSQPVHVALYEQSNNEERVSKSWEAGRELSVQLLSVIEDLCVKSDIELSGISGIIVYEGPGSYTGLRIGISIVNALGSSFDIPSVGSGGDNWLLEGFAELGRKSGFSQVTPVYGGDVYTTKPRK